jgi:hypothetical protein
MTRFVRISVLATLLVGGLGMLVGFLWLPRPAQPSKVPSSNVKEIGPEARQPSDLAAPPRNTVRSIQRYSERAEYSGSVVVYGAPDLSPQVTLMWVNSDGSTTLACEADGEHWSFQSALESTWTLESARSGSSELAVVRAPTLDETTRDARVEILWPGRYLIDARSGTGPQAPRLDSITVLPALELEYDSVVHVDSAGSVQPQDGDKPPDALWVLSGVPSPALLPGLPPSSGLLIQANGYADRRIEGMAEPGVNVVGLTTCA